jgi:chemotaxis family two-component system sensor kinase Cph1
MEFDAMSITSTPAALIPCDRELIQFPASIQPHGMMLVVDRDSLIVRQVAGEIEQRLGFAAWEGQSERVNDFDTAGFGI